MGIVFIMPILIEFPHAQISRNFISAPIQASLAVTAVLGVKQLSQSCIDPFLVFPTLYAHTILHVFNQPGAPGLKVSVLRGISVTKAPGYLPKA